MSHISHFFGSQKSAHLLVLLCVLSVLTPFFVHARERVPRIETGDARTDVVASNISNLLMTRIEAACNCTPRSTEEVVQVVNKNSADIENIFNITLNTGENGKEKDNAPLTLRELGVLQLAAHDLFDVDRIAEIERENGKLDLTTLLAHGENFIAVGGEARNRENIILSTVSAEYGREYLRLREQKGHDRAYKMMLKKYHRELDNIFKKLFGDRLPEPIEGMSTPTENLALRTIHDLLPGHIMVDGVRMVTVDTSLVGQVLSAQDLEQRTAPLDGVLDPVFRNVVIVIPPDTVLMIDLQERDSSFGVQFGAEHTFEHFLSELEDGSYDDSEDVTRHFLNAFAKGLHF